MAAMRTVRKVFTIAAVVLVLFLALVVVREAFFGYTSYFVIVPGARLLTDGKPASGWLHKGGKGQVLILTLDVAGKRESYWISRPDERSWSVLSCGDWTAPNFPLIAIGDVNPPCLSLSLDELPKPNPPRRSLVFGGTFVEFTSDDGGRVRAAW